MDRFRSVLVLANAERPLAHKLDTAVRLARRNRASLTLFDAVTAPRLRRTSTRERLTATMVDVRRAQLEEVAEGLAADDVEVVVRAGDAVFVETIREVEAAGHDILVTAPDEPGRTRLAGAPTAMHLLRKCPVPVWLTTAGTEARRGVLAAVGPFFDDTVQLNTTLLELAAGVAQRDEQPLHVATVYRVEGESLLRRPTSGMEAAEIDQMVTAAETAARAELSSMVERVVPADLDVTTHVVKGHAGEVLPRVVAGVEPRTMVIGTLARTGVRGMIVGNTAERVFGTVDCAVLAVKPPGFVTPV